MIQIELSHAFQVLPSQNTPLGIMVPIRTSYDYPDGDIIDIFVLPSQKLITDFGEVACWLDTVYLSPLSPLSLEQIILEIVPIEILFENQMLFMKIKNNLEEDIIFFCKAIQFICQKYPSFPINLNNNKNL